PTYHAEPVWHGGALFTASYLAPTKTSDPETATEKPNRPLHSSFGAHHTLPRNELTHKCTQKSPYSR
ncbi:hypothetical protein MUP59_10730, partial [Candidatus Bathyarchaeota archaeon]|nr:hypothetical protein [Candidatus Bathyarchaeota archaeon]